MDEYLKLPRDLSAERTALESAIHEAFKGASKTGGVSWSETFVLDDYGTAAERAEARAKDTERRWLDRVDDPKWVLHEGWGGFSFLDAIGFRYYLAPAMIRCIRTGEDVGSLSFQLMLPSGDEQMRRWTLDRWGLLTPEQRACVARFLRFMIAKSLDSGEDGKFEAEEWREAYVSCWSAVK